LKNYKRLKKWSAKLDQIWKLVMCEEDINTSLVCPKMVPSNQVCKTNVILKYLFFKKKKKQNITY